MAVALHLAVSSRHEGSSQPYSSKAEPEPRRFSSRASLALGNGGWWQGQEPATEFQRLPRKGQQFGVIFTRRGSSFYKDKCSKMILYLIKILV